nr:MULTISPECIES: hypothetical protein [Nocardia]
MDFTGRVELHNPPGVPTPWPAGTTAWLRLSVRGGTYESIWPADVTGAVLSWNVPAVEVADVPTNAWAELWLDYPSATPILWVEGPAAIGPCTGAGFGGTGYVVAVPGAGSGAVAVPIPGPAGPPGGGGLEFLQSTPAATWTIPHGFGRYPYGLLVIVGGELVIPDAAFPDPDTVTLTFAAPTAGRAELL